MTVRRYVSVPKEAPAAGDANECIFAMSEGRAVAFNYDGKARVVEVHAVGRSTAGKLVMRGYQVDGKASRPLPQWTLFDLSKAESLSMTSRPSGAPREGYAMADKQMALIYAELVL